MSTFSGLIYAKVSVADLTVERQNMVRASVNTDIESLAMTNDSLYVLAIFTIEFSGPFIGIPWLTKTEMQEELLGDEWQKQE